MRVGNVFYRGLVYVALVSLGSLLTTWVQLNSELVIILINLAGGGGDLNISTYTSV